MTTNQDSLIEFIGIYDADSTLIGEMSYWISARLGKSHCSLCEITHGMFTMKSEWKDCAASLSIPFRTFHRNDAPDDVLQAASGRFPLVLARFESGLQVAFNQVELEHFNGDTQRFRNALEKIISKQSQ
jgi:hypothetical protein